MAGNERVLNEAEQRRLERYKVKCEELESEGYTKTDLTISVAKANVGALYGLIMTVPFIVIYVLKYNGIEDAYRNTIFVTAVGTSISLLMTTLGAYVLSCTQMPGHRFCTFFVIFTMFFSGGLIPTYLNMRNLELLNTLWSLILPSCIVTWNMFLERNFIKAIPPQLTEAARIDGAGEFRLLLQVVLPLSMPILATLTLFYGVARWNEYSNAIIYISKQKMYTLQVIIHRMYTMSISDVLNDENIGKPPSEAVRAATVVFATLPILCVYPFLQKYFAQGLMVGSLKG